MGIFSSTSVSNSDPLPQQGSHGITVQTFTFIPSTLLSIYQVLRRDYRT